MGKLFGTDGIRGLVNKDLTCELALSLGVACTAVLLRQQTRKLRILIGMDTRASGDMLAAAMAAGFCAAGADVTLLGVLPTPAVAYLVRRLNADVGVVITASHNPSNYNGIKIFSSDGFKLPDEVEDEIEELLFTGAAPSPVIAPGHIRQDPQALDLYIQHIIDSADADLTGMRVCVDCANGAASVTARRIFEGLGLRLCVFHDNPDGFNINQKCGSTYLGEAVKQVDAAQAALGFSFDGDADRCLAVDAEGREIRGDHIVGALALAMQKQGRLPAGEVVATVLSNMGFIRMMADRGIQVHQAKVGDRYVLEEMRRRGLTLGGEDSGHVIMLDSNTTGDGQLTAVQLLCALRHLDMEASALSGLFRAYPQVQADVTADREQKVFLMEDEVFQAMVRQTAARFGDRGRVLVRPSGTEPKLRIMVEGEEAAAVEAAATALTRLAQRRLEQNAGLYT